jgi:hypothetical protein
MASDPNSSFSHDDAPWLHERFVLISRHSAAPDILSRIFEPSSLGGATTFDHGINFEGEAAPTLAL